MGQFTHAERRFQMLHLPQQQHKFGKSNCLRIHASTAMATEGHASNVQPAEANVGLVNNVVRGESDVYYVLWRLGLALVTLSHLRSRLDTSDERRIRRTKKSTAWKSTVAWPISKIVHSTNDVGCSGPGIITSTSKTGQQSGSYSSLTPTRPQDS